MSKNLEMASLTYTVPELAQALGIGKSAAYSLVHTQDFPAIKLGGKYLIPKVALEEWLLNATVMSNSNIEGRSQYA